VGFISPRRTGNVERERERAEGGEEKELKREERRALKLRATGQEIALVAASQQHRTPGYN
jgi:hypothetical protein